jgi:hypothetical protein
MVLAGRQRKIRHALDAKLVPHGAQVMRLVELDLVCHGARAELLV